MFAASTYRQRRAQLQQRLSSGLVLLPSNEESPINYHDNPYPFRQDSNFLYFIGLDKPHLAVVIDLDEGSATLFGDDCTVEDVVWMGPQPSLSEMAAAAGVEHYRPYADIAAVLADAQTRGRVIHFLPPYQGERRIQLSAWLNLPIAELPRHVSLELIQAVVALRERKTPEEVAEIEEAVNLTREMHLAAMRQARPGVKETFLRGIVEGVALSGGGYPAYSVILTVNGQTLHNHYYGNTLQNGQLVLGDFGASSTGHYAGDITRTFPVDTAFTAQQRDIYEIVLKAETECIKAVQPGILYRNVHLRAARIITEGLKDLGIMRGSVEDAVAAGAHALFFPHGLGHMLGLDVHDMEDLGENYVGYDATVQRSTQFGLKSLRLAKTLQPGFVITVEPGIYFIPQLIDLWQKERKLEDFIAYDRLEDYRHFGGIRIEDNVLVTDNGHRVLGKPIPKTVTEVEAIRQEG